MHEASRPQDVLSTSIHTVEADGVNVFYRVHHVNVNRSGTQDFATFRVLSVEWEGRC